MVPRGRASARAGNPGVDAPGRPADGWVLRSVAKLAKLTQVFEGYRQVVFHPLIHQRPPAFLISSMAICNSWMAHRFPPSPEANKRAASIERTNARLVLKSLQPM
jgi:hypothetical protein